MSGTETLWQELICRLEGVQAAQVVFAENGMPCEIHVLAGPEKSSKSLVRDIQSALTAQFGVQVDHRIISVAQLSEGLAPRGDFRLAHTGLEIKSAGGRVSASVTLARGCDTYTGHGESANTPFARRRCVSEAALAAADGRGYAVTLLAGAQRRDILARGSSLGETIAALDAFCASYMQAHGGRIDYIHGDDEAVDLAAGDGCCGILMPRMEKEELFTSVLRSGPFPKKSFSIGLGADKRYYLECRKL